MVRFFDLDVSTERVTAKDECLERRKKKRTERLTSRPGEVKLVRLREIAGSEELVKAEGALVTLRAGKIFHLTTGLRAGHSVIYGTSKDHCID